MFKGNEILFTKVKRGWDIPTGHIEVGESPEEAIKREVFEEVEATLTSHSLIGYLKSIKLKEMRKIWKCLQDISGFFTICPISLS